MMASVNIFHFQSLLYGLKTISNIATWTKDNINAMFVFKASGECHSTSKVSGDCQTTFQIQNMVRSRLQQTLISP